MTDDFYLHPLSLPPRPSLEQYKKLAKDLQHACKSAEPGAIHRWAQHAQEAIARLRGVVITPRVSDEIDRGARQLEQRWHAFIKSNERASGCALTAAQLFLAQAQGFSSWPRFTSHLEGLARANSPISHFETAVDAIIVGDLQKLEALLRENPELAKMRSTRAHRSTLLHYVSANGVEDFRQKTPQNIVEIARLLLDQGADSNAESDAYGGRSTTLGLTATSCHPQDAGVQIPLLELLIDRGATIDPPDGGSAVVGCLRNGRAQAADYLARRGARLNLEGASGIGRLDVVQTFFESDGSLRPPATQTQMAHGFAWACEFGHTAVVDFLLRRGLNVDAQGIGGETGLHWAAYGAHRDIVELLLRHGAPVDVIDRRFESNPLAWALHGWFTTSGHRPYPEVVALLVGAGAKPDPEWFHANADRSHLAEKILSDPRMLAALRGEMPPAISTRPGDEQS